MKVMHINKEVKIMAVEPNKVWAMVRRVDPKGAMPFVVRFKELSSHLTTNAGDLAEGCANNCDMWDGGCLIANCPHGHTPSA